MAKMDNPRLALLSALQLASDGGPLATMLANLPAWQRREVEVICDKRGAMAALDWLRSIASVAVSLPRVRCLDSLSDESDSREP